MKFKCCRSVGRFAASAVVLWDCNSVGKLVSDLVEISAVCAGTFSLAASHLDCALDAYVAREASRARIVVRNSDTTASDDAACACDSTN